MKSRVDHTPPTGRRLVMSFVRRFDPAKPMGFPYEPVVAEAARWPAGHDWQRRRRWAAPLRTVSQGLYWLYCRAAMPLNRLATLIEGQPLVWWCEMEGWRERRGMRDGHWRSWWAYEGEINAETVAMFEAHPDRFADSAPEVIAKLCAWMESRP